MFKIRILRLHVDIHDYSDIFPVDLPSWVFRPGNGSPSATNVVLRRLLVVIRFSIP